MGRVVQVTLKRNRLSHSSSFARTAVFPPPDGAEMTIGKYRRSFFFTALISVFLSVP